MRTETLNTIRELCARRYFDLQEKVNLMMDFRVDGPHMTPKRFASFDATKQNVVTKNEGEMVMSACSLSVKDGLRIQKLMGLPHPIDATRGTFFYVPLGTTVPCHCDEEAHDGYVRSQRLLTFNVSAPRAILYVNNTGKELDMQFSASDHFITILHPTQIFHGVVGDPKEDLYLVQFPFLEDTHEDHSDVQAP